MTITEVTLPWQACSPALPPPVLFSHNFVIFSLSSPLITLFLLCHSLPLSVCLCNFGTYARTTPLPPTLPSVALSITHPLFLSPLHLSCSLTPPVTIWAAHAKLQPSLSGVDELLPYLIFMGEIIWKSVCVGGGGYRRGRWWNGCVCVLVRDGGWRVYRVYMKHHYHIKDMLGFLS